MDESQIEVANIRKATEAEHADAKARGIVDGPHGRLQWKGTDACIDLRCSCGARGHVDGDFLYYVRCVGCGARFALSPYVVLIPIGFETPSHVTEDFGAAHE